MSLGVYFIFKNELVIFGAFAWYNVRIRVIFGVRFEKTENYEKTYLREYWNMQTLFESILNISAKCH